MAAPAHALEVEEILRISNAHDGGQADARSADPTVSADGRHVAFSSEATNLVSNDRNSANDIFVHDIQSGETSRVSVSSTGAEIK